MAGAMSWRSTGDACAVDRRGQLAGGDGARDLAGDDFGVDVHAHVRGVHAGGHDRP